MLAVVVCARHITSRVSNDVHAATDSEGGCRTRAAGEDGLAPARVMVLLPVTESPLFPKLAVVAGGFAPKP